MTRNLLSLLVMGAFVAVLAQGQQSPGREEYEKIDKRILFRGNKRQPRDFVYPSAEERAAGRKELRNIVTRTIQRTANSKGMTEQIIIDAIIELQQYDFWKWRSDEPSLPFVHLATVSGISTMTAAFAVVSDGLGIGDVSAHIQFYSSLAEGWNLVAETGEEFEGCNFKVAPLRSPIEGQAWYLAWGSVIGATRQRTKLRLYAFDGFSLRTVWSRDGLSGGMVNLENDGSVTLTYELLPPDGQRVPPTPIIQRLRPTVRGLEP